MTLPPSSAALLSLLPAMRGVMALLAFLVAMPPLKHNCSPKRHEPLNAVVLSECGSSDQGPMFDQGPCLTRGKIGRFCQKRPKFDHWQGRPMFERSVLPRTPLLDQPAAQV